MKSLVLALDPVYKRERVKQKRDGRPRLKCPLYGQVRKVLGDFSSVLAILLGCGLDAFLGLATPKLLVPTEFKVRAGQDERGKRKWGQKLGVVRRFIYPKLLSL